MGVGDKITCKKCINDTNLDPIMHVHNKNVDNCIKRIPSK